MRKVLCTVITVIMIATCIPIVTAVDEPPGNTVCWVVTDDYIPLSKDHHYFCDEYVGSPYIEDSHTQEWYYHPYGNQEEPIKEQGWYADTHLNCTAEISGDQTILTVKTSAIGDADYYDEYIDWIIINGNRTYAYFVVNVTWTDYSNTSHSTEMTITTESSDEVHLYWLQDLEMSLKYVDPNPPISPGWKEYWVETDYDTYAGKEYKFLVFGAGNYLYQDSIAQSEDPHNLNWWTDKDFGEYPGENRTIKSETWHINTKAEVWVEDDGGNGWTVCVTIYGENNYHPEQLNWTVTNAKNAPDPYFNVVIDTDEVLDPSASDWDVDIYPGAGDDFKEIGNLNDPMNVSITFYKE